MFIGVRISAMNNSPVVVVTGSSSGIGKATAIKFAQHHYRISLSGRNEDALAEVVKECEVAGAQAVTTTIGDLRDSSVARDLVEHTIKEFGQLDVLVNSAGILVTGSVEDVIQLTKFAIPHIIKQQGAIVNVSSVAGPRPFADVAFYCMSKAALDQFTKCLSLELAPHNVRVNSVNPGVIVSNIHKRAGMNDAEYKEVKMEFLFFEHRLFSSWKKENELTRWVALEHPMKLPMESTSWRQKNHRLQLDICFSKTAVVI
ncbi:Short-chain dehydrogenase reductase SDR domain containing protein [Aphelenchoides besseyi]|nr:Short-chain dehydrogenase reductase SDR domain containing protein [Aphelenchoides besseyi]KAI6208266.1 Short-chain dehydrogenase reductase SDR domain containing protein [Aphelenchoides besseyi]